MIRVGVFSESAFTFKGHGVHSAYAECRDLLLRTPGVQLLSPHALRPTDILHVHSAGPAALGLLLHHVGPKVISAHLTADSFMGSIKYAEYFRGAIERYLRVFYEQADLVLAVSAGTKSYLQDRLRITRPIR